jgi:hypothetical protein
MTRACGRLAAAILAPVESSHNRVKPDSANSGRRPRYGAADFGIGAQARGYKVGFVKSASGDDEYQIEGLAGNAAKVGVRSLTSIREEDETKLTRRVVESWILNHQKQPEANVSITIRHQRRASATEPWEDVDSYLLGSLPAGKEVRLALSSAETLKLFEELRRLYELAEEGVPAGTRRRRYVDPDLADILDGQERELLEAIIARSGDEFPELLGSIGGADLIALAAREREHGRRVEAVSEMDAHINGSHVWTEIHWKAFFEENRWIFGHGLDYRFLTSIEDEAYYGGMEVSGKGAQRGDNLYRSEADVHFTVLVEIKRPDADLVIQRPYRNGVAQPGA